ncbi:MAG: hypothetical protein WBG67_07330, partial [Thermoanaerobaculia bacterium]
AKAEPPDSRYDSAVEGVSGSSDGVGARGRVGPGAVRSQAKAEKSNFLHGDLNRLSRTAVFHVDVLMNKCPASRCAYELAFFFKTQ